MKSKYPYVVEVPALQSPSPQNNYLSTTNDAGGDEIIEEKEREKRKLNPSNQDSFSDQAAMTNLGAVQDFDEAKNNKSLSFHELKRIIKKVGFL